MEAEFARFLIRTVACLLFGFYMGKWSRRRNTYRGYGVPPHRNPPLPPSRVPPPRTRPPMPMPPQKAPPKRREIIEVVIDASGIFAIEDDGTIVEGRSVMSVLDKATFKKIEWCMFNYFSLCSKSSESRADIIYGSPVKPQGGGRASKRSDPTSSRGISLINLGENQDWIRVIESTYLKFEGCRKQELMRLYYFREMSRDRVCEELSIEKTTFYQWRDDIIVSAALFAARERLIKVG